MRFTVFIVFFLCGANALQSQEDGVENLIVEEYACRQDAEGDSIHTYRIFIDLKEGYVLQAVFGNQEHPLHIQSTDSILNHNPSGVGMGNMMNGVKMLQDSELIFDSFVTLNAVTNSYNAIPKYMDTDGSIFSKTKPKIKPLKKADGLLEGITSPIQVVYMSSEVFGYKNLDKEFYTENGAWASMQGITGPTEENIILIAQITTKGELAYELNVQVGNPYGGTDQYVAKNARGNDILCEKLYKTFKNNTLK